MNVWYAFLNALGIRMFEMDFMKNALLAVLLLGPLFGLLSTMIVTGKMSFFSDALGHSGFTGIAIGVLCGAVQPIYFAVGLSVLFALLFSFVRSRTSQSADTIIGVFSSTAVALGIFIVTLGGRSFTKFNRYLIGDILSVSPQEIGLLALVLLFAGRLVYDYAPYSEANQRLLTFLLTTAILSLGLGLFNLIPIPPLDGSKVLFSLLPDRAYNMMLRYERYGMLLLWAVVLLGVGDKWMSAAIQWTYELFCRVVGF